MLLNDQATAMFQGFSKLNRAERFERLLALGAITEEDMRFIEAGGVQELALAETLIENAIGYFQLPLGVAPNFRIDEQDYLIPMAVEETSIIAALSKTAKWVRQQGTISTKVVGSTIIGQMQLPYVNDFDRFEHLLKRNKDLLIDKANHAILASMVRRGGGIVDLSLRSVPRIDGQGNMAIIHVALNPCDAMGANILNQALEFLKGPIEELTNESIGLCILSNLNDTKLTTAEVSMPIDSALGQRLQEASIFAETDPYRAATHNKGIMNGIDAVLIATGNDWRAVEAGMHAYAARSGSYQALSQWRYQDGILKGSLTAPIIVGTVGGVTTLHPTAKLCMRMMGIESANHLSRIVAAVGLIQNLGAIRALCTEGIIKGHMRLHIDNLLLNAGAQHNEKPALKAQLQAWLEENKHISLEQVHILLRRMRENPIADGETVFQS
ncbi:MAG: hydroxymethylglutaryl-CoA reductase, degradative [Legionella sp.]|nr:hydroxymethylglutaryl-CoA reductase, degradative [Legionella sp.]